MICQHCLMPVLEGQAVHGLTGNHYNCEPEFTEEQVLSAIKVIRLRQMKNLDDKLADLKEAINKL